MGNLVISTNRMIPYLEFQRLMASATYCLNCMVHQDEKSYIKASAEAVENRDTVKQWDYYKSPCYYWSGKKIPYVDRADD